MKPSKGFSAAFIVLSFLLASCVSQRDLEYLQDKDKHIISFDESIAPDYRLKPNDELYIQITSLDEAATNVFSSSTNQQSGGVAAMQPYGASLSAYTIDKSGNLTFPVIGTIYVKDKTLSQVSLILKDSLMNILSQPIVTVKLVNRYITVLGEVRNPGHFSFAQEKLTIFDALGLAGDITPLGNRREIILSRNEDGKNILIDIDLTKSKLIGSEFYYLRPNDLVYVKPMEKKAMKLRDPVYNPLLTTISAVSTIISTAILVYTVVSK